MGPVYPWRLPLTKTIYFQFSPLDNLNGGKGVNCAPLLDFQNVMRLNGSNPESEWSHFTGAGVVACER